MKTRIALTLLAAALCAPTGCSKGGGQEERAAKATDQPPAAPGKVPGTEGIMKILATTSPRPAGKPAGGFMQGLFGGRLAPALSAPLTGTAPAGAAATGAPGATVDDSPGSAPAATADDSPGGPSAATADDSPGAIGDDSPGVPVPAAPLPPPAPAGGDCGAVAARLLAIAQAQVEAELTGADATTRQTAEQMVGPMLAQLREQVQSACQAQNWPAELRDCVLTAADMAALQGCERFATDEMRQQAAAASSAPDPVAPAPKGPPPAWDGAGDDCDAVGAQIAALTRWQISGAPEEQRAAAEPMLAEIAGQVAAACKAGSWSEAGRRCLLQARATDALQQCAASLGAP